MQRFGIPYAQADLETLERICPVCGHRCPPDEHDATGEDLTNRYGDHYAAEHETRVGPLLIDHGDGDRVYVDGESVDLQPRETRLLLALAAEPTRVFTKEELNRSLGLRAPTRTLDSAAVILRTRLVDAGAGRFVVNVWDVGYRLADTIQEEPCS